MLHEKWLACNLQWFIPEHTCIPCREMIVLNPRVLQHLDQYYQRKHPYITSFPVKLCEYKAPFFIFTLFGQEICLTHRTSL